MHVFGVARAGVKTRVEADTTVREAIALCVFTVAVMYGVFIGLPWLLA